MLSKPSAKALRSPPLVLGGIACWAAQSHKKYFTLKRESIPQTFELAEVVRLRQDFINKNHKIIKPVKTGADSMFIK